MSGATTDDLIGPAVGEAGPAVGEAETEAGPTTRPLPPDVDVVVIGAGQAGLSAAFHLRRVGFVPHAESGRARSGGRGTFVVLDADAAPGGAWQHRAAGLTMAHVHGVHELPGSVLPDADPDALARDVISAYFAAYEAEHALHVRRPVHVRAVRDVGGPDRLLAVETVESSGVAVRADAGVDDGPRRRVDPGPRARTWRTRAVVNATGTWNKPFWPAYPGRSTFRGRQLHSRDVHDVADLAGERVIVVGGGTSAVQLLLALADVAARTTWVTRREPRWIDDAALTPELGREAVARVAERTAAGLPPESVVSVTGLPLTDAYRAGIASGVLARRPMFARLVPRGARWEVGSVPDDVPVYVRADTIVWATGFRSALDHLAPLRLRAPGGGIVMEGTQVAADPRLQLVGYGPSASTVGANRAGREAVRNLRRALGL
ncbi:NAD(P)-binding domain-containing protein [Cellulomonas cellasea]|uniref:Oxidoreductase n=1 Tax=Cellulomonas cellasea TaxID=43670 RepID=A0A4Y3KSB8_9CELL|nr:NAD(P)-binding domain-containing protein [Cellulomonas cellasea]GEA86486.1 oxidoreductase [Cellulomonas cellasea]